MSRALEPFALRGRTAVITGAASEMGGAVALVLAGAGANVTLGDIDEAGLARAARRVADREERGTGLLSVRTDVTRRSDVEALVYRAVSEFGRVDVMVNLAGVIHDGLVSETDEVELDRVLAVNLKGVFFGCQAAVAVMTPQGSGSIVNIASSAVFTPFQKLACYTISKAGVVALTRVLALEVGSAGIRVNAVAPGFIEGGMSVRRVRGPDGSVDAEKLSDLHARVRRQNPLGLTGRPDDVGHAVLFLASDASRYMTGQVLHPNGGSPMV